MMVVNKNGDFVNNKKVTDLIVCVAGYYNVKLFFSFVLFHIYYMYNVTKTATLTPCFDSA